ncbi:type IV conjugative transfer system lipoprotein TraV [Deferribacterales bacterium Es71-Z0220]|uniref:type IV conjugative transfer system lipoprotein TraV n=1 Tax=Deferrivibrio essentukiensis TaxID=2880922 RepID=UPI001F623CDC|nr:type IV conjugative transfer system lipoprotein TraV [Deferrivibrio essentukiensis]MCB4205594.1 type IV conjugative transfer system lipoprotein TraV [Deferrivibrio essentukiensis]
MRKPAIMLLISFAVMFSGCAKMLSPGATEFKCPAKGTGVCADVTTVYQNRHNIETLKFKDLPDKDTYIEEKCGFLKNSSENKGNFEYNDCVYRASKEYEKLKKQAKIEDKNTKLKILATGNETLYKALRADEGIPLRQPDEVISIWIAPYKTDTGDLVYSHYIYAVRKKSDWLFIPESEQTKILRQSKQFNPLMPYLPESKIVK